MGMADSQDPDQAAPLGLHTQSFQLCVVKNIMVHEGCPESSRLAQSINYSVRENIFLI